MRISDWSSDVCSSDLIRTDFIKPQPRGFCQEQSAINQAYRAWHHQRVEEHVTFIHFSVAILVGQNNNAAHWRIFAITQCVRHIPPHLSSEERRVGKECFSPFRCRWSQDHKKKK